MTEEYGFPKNIHDVEAIRLEKLNQQILEEQDRDYYLERRYPAFEIWFCRDVASR